MGHRAPPFSGERFSSREVLQLHCYGLAGLMQLDVEGERLKWIRYGDCTKSGLDLSTFNFHLSTAASRLGARPSSTVAPLPLKPATKAPGSATAFKATKATAMADRAGQTAVWLVLHRLRRRR